MDQKRTIGPVTGATTAAAALMTVIAWLVSLAGLELPGEVQGALTVLLVLVAGWLVPSRVSRGGDDGTA